MFCQTLAMLAALTLTNAADVASAIRTNAIGRSFELRGRLTFRCSPRCFTMTLEDASGAVTLRNESPEVRTHRYDDGDVLRVKGRIAINDHQVIVGNCHEVTVTGKGPPPHIRPIPLRDIKTGAYDNRVIRLHGTIREIFHDEIDPDWIYFTLRADNESIYVTAPSGVDDERLLGMLPDAEVDLSGVCLPIASGTRRMIGWVIQLQGLEDVRIVTPAPTDPFAVSEISNAGFVNPTEIISMGRRRITGRVIAAWRQNLVLLKDALGEVHKVELAKGPPPPFGSWVTACGLPETDLYRVNLSSAIWRKSESEPKEEAEAPVALSAADILTDERGRHVIRPLLHGRVIRLRGIVQVMPADSNPYGTMILRNGAFPVPVDIGANLSALRNVSIGCEVEITGTCVVETENWRPYSAFPHANGITLVVRRPDDVRILSRPSWWTPIRLTVVIGVLILLLAAFMLWNASLRIIAERRGHELFRENVAHISADLRRDERTRLAIELHDSIAQSLSGVSMQIDAGNYAIASKTLRACREELRDCLWDLRNQTLDEENIDEAIRRTVRPHVGDAQLVVRFNVSRAKLSDSTAHALLRIIRELAVNAVRHGHARCIWIAGSFEDGVLRFSVRDNGSGFDPSRLPGVKDGHFGLQGIRERIDRLNGSMTIGSHPGSGSKITISLKRPNDYDS